MIEVLEPRAMLAAFAPNPDPLPHPPPANTPVGSFGSNCAASFFVAAPDSPPSIAQGAAPWPAAAPPAANGPALEIFVTVTADEDDGNRNPDDISLREAILIANASEANATIHLPAGTFTLTRPGRGEDTGGIGDLDIANPGFMTRILGAGQGMTLVRNGVDDRVFHVHAGSTAEIRGMSIEEGIEPNGGGIFNVGNLTLVDARLQFNFAHSLGGGVANAPGATLAISQATIVNNSSMYGGGVANNVNGAVTITATNIESNFASSGGGVFNHGGTLQIATTSIVLNSVNESGGGLANLSTTTPAVATLTTSSIVGNRVTSGATESSLAQGGGICNSADGGTASASITMTGGAISNNRATAGDIDLAEESAAQGGGIYNRASGANAQAQIAVSAVNLNANLATAAARLAAEAVGGAVFNRAENGNAVASFTATNGSASGNSVSSLVMGGQGAIDPKAIARGGAIFNRARIDNAVATVTVTGTNLNTNSAVATALAAAEVAAAGGAIYSEAGIPSPQPPTSRAFVSFSGASMRFNVADANDGTEPAARGGAIAIVGDYGHTIVDVAAATISDNLASASGANSPQAQGGAIYNRVGPLSSLSRLMIERSSIRNNRLDLVPAMNPLPRGGGMYTDGVAVTVRDSTFSGNKTGMNGEGGAIFARSAVAVVNSTISGNEARTGGGLFVHSGAASLANATVATNEVTLDGGGIFAALDAAVVLRNTLVAKNLLTFDSGSPGASDLAGAFSTTSAYNWIGSGTGSTGIADGIEGNRVGTVGSPAEPFLGPLADNGGATQTHLLYPISPLIDAGEPSFDPNSFLPALLMDQRREARMIDGNRDSVSRIDIGAVEARSTLFADLNGDGRVGLADLMIVQRHFQSSNPMTYAEGDLNGDSVVDRRDLALLVEHYAGVLAAPSPEAAAAMVRTPRDPPHAETATPRVRALNRRHVAAPSTGRPAIPTLPPATVDRVMDAQLEAATTLRAVRRRR